MSGFVSDPLTVANQRFARVYPGESGARQPVHSVYGGAHLFKFDTCRKLGGLAQKALEAYAPNPASLAATLGIPDRIADTVHARIADKLRREPVEDYRIDFEDGYGIRTDAEEDAAADGVATELARAMTERTLPPFIGFRIKPLNEECKGRSLRTLERLLTALLDQTAGKLPEHFVVTLPKITVVEQVAALADALDAFPGVRMEMMVETPQALFRLPELLEAARGRCVAAHFGPYDYTATLGITAAHQHLLHPACEFARSMIQTSLAGTGVWIADGPTNIMPIPPHRGSPLTETQAAANREVVQRAWRLHYGHVRHALANGFYQGWDLHPAQLPVRYAAVYSFFLEGLDTASERLRNFMAHAAQATMAGDVFDDAATGQGLLNYFLRAIRCGTIPEAEIPALTGLTLEQLRTASFAQIVTSRRRDPP